MRPTEIFRSASFRLTLALAGAFSLLTLLLFAFLYWQTAIFETNRIDQILRMEISALAGEPRAEIIHAVGLRLSNDLHRLTFAGLFDAAGQPIAGNLPEPPAGLAADGQVHRIAEYREAVRSLGREPALAIAQRLPDGTLLVIGRDIDELVELRRLVQRALLLGLVPAVLLSLGISIELSSRSLNHIKVIHRSLARIMRGHIDERLPTRGTRDDLDQLTYAVNNMLDEIASLLRDLRGIGDNIAHDLRIPLARLRARLERSRAQPVSQPELEAAVDRTIADLDQVSAIIAAILRIGEIETKERFSGFSTIDTGEMVRELAELFQPIAEAAHIALNVQIAHPEPIVGDRDLLMEAFSNLLDNALKFTPAGGSVFLTASYRTEDRHTIVRVADTGPGIPASERAFVMKRFYRADKSRQVPGSGLGLSIVQAIMRLHGFQIAIVGEPPGCVFEVACGDRVDSEREETGNLSLAETESKRKKLSAG